MRMNENALSVISSRQRQAHTTWEVFELRPDMKNCRQHNDTGKEEERAIKSH